MTTVKIAAIVEGHGEIESVPILIRRIAGEVDPGIVPKVLGPIRIPATKLLKDGEIERAVTLAARKLQGHGGIVVILDSDWKGACPATDGPSLLMRAKSQRCDIPISVVLAKMEYEAWFLAAAESLRGKRGLPTDLIAPSDPEAVRDAKGWIANRMAMNRKYTETLDQPAFTHSFDFESARRADSFDKCYRDIKSMIVSLSNHEAEADESRS